MQFNPCLLIPTFNNHFTVRDVVQSVAYVGLPCIVVDDGSDDDARQIVRDLTVEFSWVQVVQLPKNGGKGSAVVAGAGVAYARGFTHAVQLDADGQHHSADLTRFIETARSNPEAVVQGRPIFDDSAPRVRVYGRVLTNLMVWLETASFEIKDALCGFRVYPLAQLESALRDADVGRRMEFDPEILVRLHWRGCHVINIPTKVRYPHGGVSHFRCVRDNLLMVWMHLRLLVELAGRGAMLLGR